MGGTALSDAGDGRAAAERDDRTGTELQDRGQGRIDAGGGQRRYVDVGSNDGRIYALDADSGEQLQRHLTGGAVDSSPAVVDGVAYVDSLDGDLYVLNAATGALQWRYRTDSVVLCSAAVAVGKVFFGFQ